MWPCMLVKSHEQLLEDEVRCYPDPSRIDPILLGFSMLGGEGMDLARVLETASEDEFFRGQEKYWNDAAHDIVEGIALSVGTFPQRVMIAATRHGFRRDRGLLASRDAPARLRGARRSRSRTKP